MWGFMAGLIPHIRGGALRALAIGSTERSAALPEVPTVAEAGVPGYEAVSWIGMVAPAGMPGPRHGRAVGRGPRRRWQEKSVSDILVSGGSEIVASKPEEFRQVIERDYAKYGKLSDLFKIGEVSSAMDASKSDQGARRVRGGLRCGKLPDDVRQKLGWLLLDYLRVCSIGARLPWSDWSRRYVGLVGRAGAFACAVLAPTRVNPAARDLPQRHLRLELRRRRHPCRRDAASRRRGLVGGARGRRAHRRVGAGGAGRGRRRLRDHDPHRACGAAEPFQARLPEHRHLRRVRHRGGGGAAVVSRRGCRAEDRRRARARRRLRQRPRAVLLFGRIGQAHPGGARGRGRRRRGAARGGGLHRADRHHRRAGRLCPRLCRRLESGADRGRARPALPSDGRAGEVPRGGGARRGRHRRDAGAAPSSTSLPPTTSRAWRSAFRRSSRGG